MDGWMARRPGMIGSYFGSEFHRSGMEWVKGELGAGRTAEMRTLGIGKWTRMEGAFRAAGPIALAYFGYKGYQEGGAWGAAREVGTHLAFMYMMPTIGKTVGLAALGGAAVLGMQYGMTGAGPLETLTRPLVREHMRKHAKLEMGRPIHDQFGNVATMRQRSIMAMQNSKINGRSALGHEATLAYRPYFR